MMGVLLGNRGAGKTQMGACAIRIACKKELPAKYCKAIDFFLDVRATYKKDSPKTEQDIIQEYRKPFMLVVDAIENRGETDFENTLLNHLIDIRYDDCKDTILISNQTEQAFATSMGASIVDRIYECGVLIICNWKSFRRN
jgi:DNA replication protein DnaC